MDRSNGVLKLVTTCSSLGTCSVSVYLSNLARLGGANASSLTQRLYGGLRRIVEARRPAPENHQWHQVFPGRYDKH
jgi:hypothetical protein